MDEWEIWEDGDRDVHYARKVEGYRGLKKIQYWKVREEAILKGPLKNRDDEAIKSQTEGDQEEEEMLKQVLDLSLNCQKEWEQNQDQGQEQEHEQEQDQEQDEEKEQEQEQEQEGLLYIQSDSFLTKLSIQKK